ncbi:hypothetical protein BC835DRAFT_1422401 [Cytidiella melzeri]|nr:hypothetical protein BC835DRAFT_1422401 [Cytidiella melzeri]
MAHLQDLWEVVSNVQDLIELRSKTPEDLIATTAKIVTEYALTNVLMKLGALSREEQDNLLKSTVIYCCDDLDYCNLDNAMLSGDVGCMELLLLLIHLETSGHATSTNKDPFSQTSTQPLCLVWALELVLPQFVV